MKETLYPMKIPSFYAKKIQNAIQPTDKRGKEVFVDHELASISVMGKGMEIYIGNITDSRNRVRQQDIPATPDRPKRERRKARRDRRRSVREGIVVTLSIKNDRRTGRDRRRKSR